MDAAAVTASTSCCGLAPRLVELEEALRKARQRRESNVHAKLKVMGQRGELLRAALEKRAGKEGLNKKKGKKKPGIIVTVPSAYKSKVGVSKFA